TRVHSPIGLSTSFFPRVSSSSLKSGSWFDHQNCFPEYTVGVPPFFHRGRLSGPSTVSTVRVTGCSLVPIAIRSPAHPWASWTSSDGAQAPFPASPTGPAWSSSPELRTYFPPSVRAPHLYSTVTR